jgi:hypothetical protein
MTDPTWTADEECSDCGGPLDSAGLCLNLDIARPDAATRPYVTSDIDALLDRADRWDEEPEALIVDLVSAVRALTARLDAAHRSDADLSHHVPLLPAALDVIARLDEQWVWDGAEACWWRDNGLAGETDPEPNTDAVRAVLDLVNDRQAYRRFGSAKDRQP